MKVESWRVLPDWVAKGIQRGDPRIVTVGASEPGPCPYAAVYTSDGKIGLTAQFESPKELGDFKCSVAAMSIQR